MQVDERLVPAVKASWGKSDRQMALAGVRVLDMSRLVAGNMASLQLGDFGADVIKIEPLTGDPLRAWKEGSQALFWKNYSRNKRSIALDLRSAEAMAVLGKLIASADVLIENFKPGTLEKMGLAPERLKEMNPDLIVLRISGFGQTGPYAKLPGFGTLVEAMSGLASRTGFPDREPVLPPLALADMVAGIYGASAVAIALYARREGRARGQVIDLSLLESIFSTLGPEIAAYKQTGKVKQRVGSGSNTSAPRNIYRCGDGKYLALSGSIQAMAERVFRTIGRDDMVCDPRFATNAARVRNRPLLDEILSEWLGARTREEALDIMRAADVTAGPVYDIADIAGDSHFRDRGVFIELPDQELGSTLLNNAVPRLDDTPASFRIPAPELGEHTDLLLSELGFSVSEAEGLRQRGVVR